MKNGVGKKRKQGRLTATTWGCEIQGSRGRAGAPREKRAALAALTFAIACLGFVTTELLASVLGMWADVLL